MPQEFEEPIITPKKKKKKTKFLFCWTNNLN